MKMFAIGSEKWAGASKVIEEAGEVVQVLGKLMATYGGRDHWDGRDLLVSLEEEIGDLQAALDFFVAHTPISAAAVAQQRERKLAMFEGWHAAQIREGEREDRDGK